MTPVFSHGRLRLYLLTLLAEGPKHGYELMRLLEERFQGLYVPSAGTIYPRLARMETEGLVTHVEAGGRKTYAITPAGEAELTARASEVAALAAEIEASLSDLTGYAEEIAQQVRGGVRDTRRQLREQTRAVNRGGPVIQARNPVEASAGNADLQRQLDAFTDEARGLIARAKPDPGRSRAVTAALDSTLRTLRDLLR
ncbi:DNA-binding PadR family transcriptional regulator [Allocatelliglobosispora scoriae]|uniref:DNA-binding PadR family transcriptional regulator n=1 Tax=Allocatelliglobosispora scoriae TaxID=643052 RepID=A0A841BYE3_9ACTN|nr:PadR family transcriptional regulator [Allocatelliglobosispora scoriae]MBB5871812.1 DNA-binding PadR family transcriptional regulator [Allocatelliglobosispora scoriae]